MVESDADVTAPPEEEDRLPLTEYQLAVERCCSKFRGRQRFCALSAFRHLRKAWLIRNIDAEMAVFRVITAEEEAASALMLALKQKQYPKSQYLNHRDHLHKAAITPFLRAVARTMEAVQFAEPKVIVNEHATPPSLHVEINMQNMGAHLSEPLYGSPDQPFNFSIRKDSNEGPVHMFEDELRGIATDRGLEEITKLIKDEANTRNRVLYAADNGVPRVEVKDAFYLERARRAVTLLVLAIGISQTPTHQLFAVQCLHAFLRALKKIDESEVDFPELERASGLGIFVSKLGDSDPEAWINYHSSAVVPFTYTFHWNMVPLSVRVD